MTGESPVNLAMSKSEAQESSISDSEIVSESRFECPICLAWLRDPVLTSCGHRFCRLCIQSWLQREGACPVDNMKLIPTDLFPDNFTRREILQHRTNCPNNNLGCTEKISPLDIESHIANCQYKITEIDFKKYYCLFKDAGCTAEFKSSEESQEHLSKNMSYHLTLLCSVYSQLKTKYDGPSSDKAQETFFWDPPTKEGSSATEGASSTKDSLHNLLKVLYEKIVLLEQKNREQDIIITNMSQQITVNNSKLTELPLRYCNGTFFWTVKDFHSKLEAMYSDPNKMFYSSGFYTNPNGYKLCLRLNLSPYDNQYLALIVHVMKSEHDFILDWPLNARITIILVHPSVPSINIRETMLTKPELEAFRKPTQGLNPRGFGYTEFALISDLKNEGYLKNDEVHFKVQVYTA